MSSASAGVPSACTITSVACGPTTGPVYTITVPSGDQIGIGRRPLAQPLHRAAIDRNLEEAGPSPSIPPAAIHFPSGDQLTEFVTSSDGAKRLRVAAIRRQQRHRSLALLAQNDCDPAAISRNRRRLEQRAVGATPYFARLAALMAPQPVAAAARRQVVERRSALPWRKRPHRRHRSAASRLPRSPAD